MQSVGSFLRMVFHQDVHFVFMLCSLFEGKRAKCEKYWPDSGESLESEGITIKHEGEDLISEKVVSRKFSLTNSAGEEKKFEQWHYTGWPDHGVPKGSSLKDF